MVKNLPASAGATRDLGSIPGSEGSPGVRNGNLFQYSWLGNCMNTEAWQGTALRVEKNWIRLNVCVSVHVRAHSHTQPSTNPNETLDKPVLNYK